MNVTLSVRDMDGIPKDDRAMIKYYQKFIECPFEHLVNILQFDTMYSPWNYIGYTQNTLNICSDAQFVVIDVDSTSLSINQRYQQLLDEDLQFIVSTTSDPTNMHKYRVLFPLSRPINPTEYRSVVNGIREYGLIADMDTASAKPAQKFYSYAGSVVLPNFDGNLLDVDSYTFVQTTSTTQSLLLSPDDDITSLLSSFDSYRTATKGKRTRALLSAAYRCIELGMSNKQLEQVITYVNNNFLIPKPFAEVQRRVLNFINTQRRNT